MLYGVQLSVHMIQGTLSPGRLASLVWDQRDSSAESQQARPSVSELTLYPAGRLLVASSAWQPPGRDVRAKLSLVGSPL